MIFNLTKIWLEILEKALQACFMIVNKHVSQPSIHTVVLFKYLLLCIKPHSPWFPSIHQLPSSSSSSSSLLSLWSIPFLPLIQNHVAKESYTSIKNPPWSRKTKQILPCLSLLEFYICSSLMYVQVLLCLIRWKRGMTSGITCKWRSSLKPRLRLKP